MSRGRAQLAHGLGENLEETRAKVREALLAEAEGRAAQKLHDKLLRRIMKDYDFDVPSALVERRAAERAQEFLNSPHFEQVIVGLNGRTSVLRTIDPKTFVEFKHWMSSLPTRDPLKRHRDQRQALAVEELLSLGKLLSKR